MHSQRVLSVIFVLGGLALWAIGSDGLYATSTSSLSSARVPNRFRYSPIRRLCRLRGGDDAFEAALQLKAAGATLWSQSNYTGSIEKFSAALKLLNSCAADDVMAHREEIINCLNNRAACYFKLEEYASAITDCTDALSLDPANKKVTRDDTCPM